MMCGAARSSGSPEMKHCRRKYSEGGIESGTPFAEIVSNAASIRSRNDPIQPQPTSSTPRRSMGKRSSAPIVKKERNACCEPWRPITLQVLARSHELGARGSRGGLVGQVDRDRRQRAGPVERIVVRMTVGLARVRERGDPAGAAPVGDGALELARRRLRIAEREMRDGDEAPTRIAAEVGDPAVVCALIGERQFGIVDLALPEQRERRVEHALLEVLVEQPIRCFASPPPKGM